MADFDTLKALTRDALNAFKNAKKPDGNYNALMKYLCPHHVVVHRVDDATPIQGSAEDIVANFNADQVGKWPRLDFDDSDISWSPQDNNVVVVRGQYCDTETAEGISVICSYHFDTDNKIDVVFATPLGKRK